MTDAEVCLAAARLIEQHGWTQHTAFDNEGRMCALGAFMAQMMPQGDVLLVKRVFGSWEEVRIFNDRLDTTADEVIALLESGAYSLMDEVPL